MSNNVSSSGVMVSGFYYDTQKDNKLLSATLHPNMITKDNGNTWERVPDDQADDNDENLSLDKVVYRFRKKPIAKAIIKDDFTVAVANNWTDFSMGDQITQMWNSVKPFAPYAHFLSDKLKQIQQANKEMEDDNESTIESAVYGFAKKAVDFVTPYIDKAGGYLDRALVIQGTRFSYYSGTGTSFGNLQMKYTIFADWINGEFKTVDDQLSELYPYVMGKYVPWSDDKSDSMNEFVGWQKPPGGFESNVKSLDTVQKGTLKLKFGGYYSISNLVIKDAQFIFSKQMVKNPTKLNVISPLYCEVQLTLQPATKFSDISLRNFITGSYMKADIEEVRKDLNDKLAKVQIQNKKILGQSLREVYLTNKGVGVDQNSLLGLSGWVGDTVTDIPDIPDIPIKI